MLSFFCLNLMPSDATENLHSSLYLALVSVAHIQIDECVEKVGALLMMEERSGDRSCGASVHTFASMSLISFLFLWPITLRIYSRKAYFLLNTK